jgi:hypothetical protein
MTPFIVLGLTLASAPSAAGPGSDATTPIDRDAPVRLEEPAPTAPPAPTLSHGDLFPPAGHATMAGATGLPFYAIGEAGFAFGDGVTLGAIGGVTPSVWTFGIRPRFRVAIGPRTAFVLVAPILYYPRASAPGPGNIGSTTWVLTRPELFFDGAIGRRWHVGGGMGLVAAAATEALGESLTGHRFALPPYNGSDPRHGFAGGVWNTLCARTSVAIDAGTHLFLESSLVLSGFLPANDVGGPPIVVTLGAQHTF